jgi:hypothetical protein
MTQLRQVEVDLQAREQRALARLEGKPRKRRPAAKRSTSPAPKARGKRAAGA